MSAYAPIRVDPTVTERAHAHAIKVHCPNCDDMELAARCDLATIRDAAMVGFNRACEPSATMLMEVAKLATQAVYAQIPTSRLLRVRAALNFTMEAARAVEMALRDG